MAIMYQHRDTKYWHFIINYLVIIPGTEQTHHLNQKTTQRWTRLAWQSLRLIQSKLTAQSHN